MSNQDKIAILLVASWCVITAIVMFVWPRRAMLVSIPRSVWAAIRKVTGFRAWWRENIHTFGQSMLFFRVTVWTSVLVPYYYKHHDIPGFLKALTPRDWPVQELTPEIQRKMLLIHSYAVGILNQYESQRNRMCFRRSLVLYRFLRHYGVPARWYLGVRRLDDNEQAPPQIALLPFGDRYIGHAWVEINGKHFMDEMDGLRTYKINFTYPDEERYAEEVRRVYVKTNLEDLRLPRLTDLGGDGDAWFE